MNLHLGEMCCQQSSGAWLDSAKLTRSPDVVLAALLVVLLLAVNAAC